MSAGRLGEGTLLRALADENFLHIAIGIFAVLLLYAVLLWRAFVIARRGLDQGHRFAGFLAQGIGLLLALQAVIHIGVNTGLLPTKGLTLPLMSYGGSSMLSSMAAIGLLFAVDRHTRPRPPQSSKTPGPKGRGAT